MKLWEYFLKAAKGDILKFSVAIREIQKYIESVFDAIANEGKWQGQW